MSSDDVTDAYVLAAALQGEASFWFAVPRSGKPLQEMWTSSHCFWMYPVEHDLARFARVKGFNPTDSVYELDTSGVSKVFPSATLRANIKAKRYHTRGGTFFFIPADEVANVEREYKALLKREAERHQSEALVETGTRRVEARRNAALDDNRTAEDGGNDDGETKLPEAKLPETKLPEAKLPETKLPETKLPEAKLPEAKLPETKLPEAKPPESEAPRAVIEKSEKRRRTPAPAAAEADREAAPHDGRGAEDGDSADSEEGGRSESRQRRAQFVGSHRRRTPHQGTTVYIAPARQNATGGEHKSNEAFTWRSHFIVHRGSADYLCPAATGNTYGFRLDKVTHNGFPVFLLFGSPVNNAESVDRTANGVPAMETAVVKGEGGDRGMGNSVMIITRPPSEKHGYRDGSGSSAGGGGGGGGGSRRRRRIGMDSDDDDDFSLSSSTSEAPGSAEDEDDDDDGVGSGSRRARRNRKAAAPKTTGPRGSKAAKVARVEIEEDGGRKVKKEKKPLRTTSVNIWTDLDVAVPDVEQLSKQFTFACDTSTPLRTTVFPDGTCVTYSAASAEKVQPSIEKKQASKSSGGGSGNGGRIGGNTPDDDAIRSLLENVQLAQLQNQSASGAS